MIILAFGYLHNVDFEALGIHFKEEVLDTLSSLIKNKTLGLDALSLVFWDFVKKEAIRVYFSHNSMI